MAHRELWGGGQAGVSAPGREAGASWLNEVWFSLDLDRDRLRQGGAGCVCRAEPGTNDAARPGFTRVISSQRPIVRPTGLRPVGRIHVVRHSRLHRRLQALAWLAMLLVLCAPLVSRWWASAPPAPMVAHVVQPAVSSHAPQGEHGHAEAMAAGHAHHHDMSAHRDHHAEPSAEADSHLLPAADPHADHEMGVDCDYCLIAARLITLLVAVLLLLVPSAPIRRALVGPVRVLPARLMGTLGARGPPVRVAWAMRAF